MISESTVMYEKSIANICTLWSFGQTTENDDLCIKFHQMTYGIYTGETKWATILNITPLITAFTLWIIKLSSVLLSIYKHDGLHQI